MKEFFTLFSVVESNYNCGVCLTFWSLKKDSFFSVGETYLIFRNLKNYIIRNSAEVL